MEEGAEYAELSWISSVKHRYSRSLLRFSQYNCNKEAVVHILPYYVSWIITYIPVCNKELLNLSLHGKNNFVEIFTNLVRYRFENNLVYQK